jgi:transposase
MKKRTTKTLAAHLDRDASNCTTVAVDLAKNVFQVAGEDALGQIRYEERFKSREAFWRFIRSLQAGVTVAMETGPGAQAWARELQAGGKVALILPAHRVAAHQSGPKNDRNDAHAILRARRDQEIHPVPVKSVESLAMQGLHRVRKGYTKRRTAISSQIRGLLLEHGIALPQGTTAMAERVGRVLEDATQPIPDLLRELVAELLAEWTHLGERLDALNGKLKISAHRDDTARRLLTVRGFGPVISTALVAKQVRPERFPNARKFAAHFGLVPDQDSTGNRTRLGRMTKRGDGYLRGLLIEGAHAVLRQVKPESAAPDDRRLLRWMQRHGRKGAAVRLANRNLRITWVLLQNTDTYHRERAMNT